MTDNKLGALIEEYGDLMESSKERGMDEVMGEMIKDAKQAILDYVEAEKQDAIKAIKEVYEKYKNWKQSYEKTCCFDLWQAIITTGLKAGWIKK